MEGIIEYEMAMARGNNNNPVNETHMVKNIPCLSR